MHARKHLDQRRLARAIFTYESMYFTAAHIKIDVGKRIDAGESLGNIFQANEDVGSAFFLLHLLPSSSLNRQDAKNIFTYISPHPFIYYA